MRPLALLTILTGATALIGCNSQPIGASRAHSSSPTIINAQYTATPIVVDGVLDEPVWKTAPLYQLAPAQAALNQGKSLQEPGQAQLAWDDQYLYIAVWYADSDVVAENDRDQAHHYQSGDVFELFLKPADQSWYWELYATPHGKKTCFWFPGRGRLGLPSGFEQSAQTEIKVAANVVGTLNHWQDKDQGWYCEMAVPIKELTARGEAFGPDAPWLILVARYNYTRYSPYTGPELSTFPQLISGSNHVLEEYAGLRFVK